MCDNAFSSFPREVARRIAEAMCGACVRDEEVLWSCCESFHNMTYHQLLRSQTDWVAELWVAFNTRNMMYEIRYTTIYDAPGVQSEFTISNPRTPPQQPPALTIAHGVILGHIWARLASPNLIVNYNHIHFRED